MQVLAGEDGGRVVGAGKRIAPEHEFLILFLTQAKSGESRKFWSKSGIDRADSQIARIAEAVVGRH